MHRFSDSPTVSFCLFIKSTFPICIKVLINICCLIDDTQILFYTYNNVIKYSFCILSKCIPRFLDNPFIIAFIIRFCLIAKQMLQVIARNLGILACRGIIQVVYMVASGTSNHNGIHSMMTMIYAFFTESLLIFQWNFSLEYPLSVFIFPMPETFFSNQCIQAFKTRIDNVIPHIIHSPILFQSVRHTSIANQDILGNSFLFILPGFVFFTNNVRQQPLDNLTNISAIIQLAFYELFRYVIHQ